MHHISATKILYMPHEADGYLFTYCHAWREIHALVCLWDFDYIQQLDSKKRDQITALYEQVQFWKGIPFFDNSTGLNGFEYMLPPDRVSQFFSSLRFLYQEMGYYDETKMTFSLPKNQRVPCRVIIPMKFLVYSQASKSWTSGSTRDALRALNDGIISVILLATREQGAEQVREYLLQSHAFPTRLAEVFGPSLLPPSSVSQIIIPSISWLEAPLE